MLKNEHLEKPKLNANQKSVAIHLFQLLAGVVLLMSSGIPDIKAAFELNFQPLNPTTNNVTYQSWGQDDDSGAFSCGMSFQTNQWCHDNDEIDAAHYDQTPMYQRIFRDNATGNYYWHIIIGDYYNQAGNPINTQGFNLEYIIQASSTQRFQDEIYNAASASATWVDSDTAENSGGFQVYDTGLNGNFTTSGQANPKRVLVRQIMADNETVSTFLKDGFNSKPFISQTVVDNLVTHPNTTVNNEFTLDMRMVSYDSIDNSGVIMKNITNIGGGFEAANQGDYDTTNASFTPHLFNQEDRVMSAGKFTWTPGTGVLGADGTYTYYYADDTVNPTGFQPTDKNYQGFCRPSDNINWSGFGACKDYSNSGEGTGRFGWD